jgi:hypothetical protein
MCDVVRRRRSVGGGARAGATGCEQVFTQLSAN